MCIRDRFRGAITVWGMVYCQEIGDGDLLIFLNPDPMNQLHITQLKTTFCCKTVCGQDCGGRKTRLLLVFQLAQNPMKKPALIVHVL